MLSYTKFCADFVFPIHERLKGHSSVSLRRFLEKSQWWPADQLHEYRVRRLSGFLQQVGNTVPYYRTLFQQEQFDPGRLGALEDIRKLPLLTKSIIRSNVDTLKSGIGTPLSRYNTGGSSGEPLIFYIDSSRKSHDVAAKWRATRWWGVDIGDRELVVWGSPVELAMQDRVRRLRDAVLRSRLLPAFEMSPQNLDRFVSTIRSARPTMLFGYPSSLALIGEHARKKGVPLDKLGIRVVFVTSERLYEDQREIIRNAFGAPVANGYGARDAGFIAHECPAGSLHVSAEDVIVEIVRDDGRPARAGEAGEIVITHMATPGFPFIRYRTGDIGVLSDTTCPCGRGLPVLQEIHGRTTDFVVAGNGTVMHGLALIYTVRDLPGVERFKIVQESLDRTEVLLVANPSFRADSEARIVRDFKKRLGQEVNVSVRYVDAIPAEASGKFRYVVSKIAPGQQREAAVHA